MWFLTEACFKILRLPLLSWRRNESVSGLIFWFRVLVGPACKTRQQSNWQFTNCRGKRDFEQTTPNIGILYTVENNFSSRLTIWGFYLKTKPRLVQLYYQSFDNLSRKACFEIRPPSSRMEGTVTIMGSKRTSWRLGMPPTMVGDNGWPLLHRSLPRTIDRCRGWHTGS